jgi:hypothetical protein
LPGSEPSSKQIAEPPAAPAAAAETEPPAIQEKISLIDQLDATLTREPQTPLFRAAAPATWLRESWPEPVRPHTPAWTLALGGQISPRDLVALILAVWADATVKHPPRYLSWIIQRWQTLPETPPVEHWARWQALADLPLEDWFERGRQTWIELAAREKRDLPFGLDLLAPEPDDDPVNPPFSWAALDEESEKSPDEGKGLDEQVNGGTLTMRHIWTVVVGELRVQMNPLTFSNWVEGTRPVSYIDGVLTVRARHAAGRDGLEHQLNGTIEASLSKLAKTPVKARYVFEPPAWWVALQEGRL